MAYFLPTIRQWFRSSRGFVIGALTVGSALGMFATLRLWTLPDAQKLADGCR